MGELGFPFSGRKLGYMNGYLEKSTPTPKEGEFSTILLIIATTFSGTFEKFDYIGLTNILHIQIIYCYMFTIIHTSQVMDKW